MAALRWYGSEFHVLRLLGRHRQAFSSAVASATGLANLIWLDFLVGRAYRPVAPEGKSGRNYPKLPDQEWLALDFLRDVPALARVIKGGSKAADDWEPDFWPRRRGTGTLNWDAVGYTEDPPSVVLVEAKARAGEIRDTKERRHGRTSAETIRNAFEKTQMWLSIASDGEAWRTSPYYQYANRLAALYYLRQDKGITAFFVPLYLCGDKYPGKPRGDSFTNGDYCPTSARGWTRPLAEMNQALGLVGVDKVRYGIHEVFLDAVRVESC